MELQSALPPNFGFARDFGRHYLTALCHTPDLAEGASLAPIALRGKCAGQVGSLVDLLQGRHSQGVMQLVTNQDDGLFPRPAEIEMSCSCPDWADMCKHVAAVLYGVGARLDQRPELLFALRKVDHLELLAGAGKVPALQSGGSQAGPTIAADQLSDVFGIEIDTDPALAPASAGPAPKAQKSKAQKSKLKRSPSARKRAKSAPDATTGHPPKGKSPTVGRRKPATGRTSAKRRISSAG